MRVKNLFKNKSKLFKTIALSLVTTLMLPMVAYADTETISTQSNLTEDPSIKSESVGLTVNDKVTRAQTRETLNKIERVEGLLHNKKNGKDVGMWFMKVGDQYGDVTYCLEYNMRYPSGNHNYTSGIKPDNILYSILKNGYPWVSEGDLGFTGPNAYKDAYVATQLAVWSYTNYAKIDVNNVSSKCGPRGDKIIQIAKNIYNGGIGGDSPREGKMSVSPTSSKMTIQGNELVSEAFKVSVSSMAKYTEYEVSLDNAPAGAYTCDTNGNKKSTFGKGESFLVKVPINSNAGSMTINVSGKGKFPAGVVYESYSSSVQNMVVIRDNPQTFAKATATVSWDEQRGTAEVLKVDEEGKGITGAEFTLNKDGKQIGDPKPIGEDSRVRWLDIVPGDYEIIEVKAPEGYVLDSTPIPVTVKANEVTSVTKVNCKAEGTAQVIKVDESGKKLKGAQFKLQTTKGEQIGDIKETDEHGIVAWTGIAPDDYEIVEVKAPEGFILDDTPMPVTVKHGEISSVTKKNVQAKGKAVIKKIDEATGKPLANGEFKLMQNGEQLKVVKSDKNGKGDLGELPLGIYQVQEIKAPEGYIVDKTIHEFEIAEHGQEIEIVLKNTQIVGMIQIVKTESGTGAPIEGAVFGAFKGDTEVAKATTDKKGIISFDNLPYDTYTIKEISPAPGFKPSDKTWEVTVKEHGETTVLEITNELIRTNLKVLKVDEETKKPLANATFELYAENVFGYKPDTLIKEVTTDESGSLLFEDLVYGTYYLKETKAPEGYLITQEKYPVVVDKDGVDIEMTITNRLIKAGIEITKKDESSGEVLKGAEYIILNSNKEPIKKGITGEKGSIAFAELTVGTYYFQETKAPDGYVQDLNLHEFEITEHDKLYKRTHTNKKIEGILELTKTDVSDGKLLPNCIVMIYDANENVVIKDKTDENGIIRFTLPAGKYYYQEVQAPEGYLIDNGKYPFVIEEDGTIVKAHMTNQRLPHTGTVGTGALVVAIIAVIAGISYFVFKKTGKARK